MNRYKFTKDLLNNWWDLRMWVRWFLQVQGPITQESMDEYVYSLELRIIELEKRNDTSNTPQ